MANRTVKDAHSIHGTNPQYLVEKIIRTRIYDSRYWKEECFALSGMLQFEDAMCFPILFTVIFVFSLCGYLFLEVCVLLNPPNCTGRGIVWSNEKYSIPVLVLYHLS